MTEISVIVPVYNVESYLHRCISSILAQTYDDFELILVDDGSTDQSGKICDDLALSDRRIQVIHKENGGLSSARNAGLDACTGKYIAFVDSDDFIAPVMLEKLHSLAEKENADIAECGIAKVSDSNLPQDAAYTDNYIVTTGPETIPMLYKGCLPGTVEAWRKLYRREVFHSLRFEEGRINEDTLIAPFLYFAAKKVVTTPNRYYFYFQRPGSIMHSDYSLKKLDMLYIYEKQLNFYAENGLKEAYNLLNVWYPFSMVKALRNLKEHRDLDPDKSIRRKIFAAFRSRFPDFIKNPELLWKQQVLLTLYLLSFSFTLGGKRNCDSSNDIGSNDEVQ